MSKHYKDTPWWWYAAVLVISFVLGLVVVVKEDITLSAWAYVVALILGIIIAPLVSLASLQTDDTFYLPMTRLPNMTSCRVSSSTLDSEMVLPRITCQSS